MASATAACAHTEVVKARPRKRNAGMATFAAECGLKMLRWLDHIALCKLPTVYVTRGTGSRRSFENSIDMTRFARCIGMHACECKSGFDVIEIFINGLGKAADAAQ
jgi:hypothetical protein